MENNGKKADMEYTDTNRISLVMNEGVLSTSAPGYNGPWFTPDAVQKVSIALDLVGRETVRGSEEAAKLRAACSSEGRIRLLRREAAWRLQIIEEYEKAQAEKKTPPEWETEEALEALALLNARRAVSAFKSWAEVSSDRGMVQRTFAVWLKELRKKKEAERAEQDQLEKLALRLYNALYRSAYTSLSLLAPKSREIWLGMAQAAKDGVEESGS